jgi:hypothetical protein
MDTIAAKRMFLQYTDGTGEITRLWGARHRMTRASIMHVLHGSKVPEHAQWHRFVAGMMALYQVDKNLCEAAQAAQLAERATGGIVKRDINRSVTPGTLIDGL